MQIRLVKIQRAQVVSFKRAPTLSIPADSILSLAVTEHTDSKQRNLLTCRWDRHRVQQHKLGAVRPLSPATRQTS